MKERVELGYRVSAGGRDVGVVDQLVVDPQEREPEYLVVRRGRLRPRRIVVPVSLVTAVEDERVELHTSPEALEAFPDYEVTVTKGRYERPVPVGGFRPVATFQPDNREFMVLTQRSVPDHSVGVSRDMPVADAHGRRVGSVHGAVADASDREGMQMLLRTADRPRSRCRVVPMDLIADVDGGQVRLRIDAEHIAGLPECAEESVEDS